MYLGVTETPSLSVSTQSVCLLFMVSHHPAPVSHSTPGRVHGGGHRALRSQAWRGLGHFAHVHGLVCHRVLLSAREAGAQRRESMVGEWGARWGTCIRSCGPLWTCAPVYRSSRPASPGQHSRSLCGA